MVVDLRVGSAAFGQWDAVLIDDGERRAIYLPDGFGHAFLALEHQHSGQLPLLRGVRTRA